ncbi:hypothetical protein BDV96DRAFT_606264 [Lophiotrema nucula]|uniref:BZIP domain-containing protein n=1 Tax=Lophiotrema nucula TaxID=690887 RepID=A0A6A5YNF4_9PLEO|nr:hypothetical protein BDV96DRAFT_606264 [Lophiotrema nucula]
MDPMDNSFEGISQGTLDWINETFTLFHSDQDAPTARFDKGNSPSQPNQAAIPSTEYTSSDNPQHDTHPNQILDTSFEFDHDALQRSQTREVAGAPQRSSFRHEKQARSLETHHQMETSNWSFRLSSSVPPTPSITTPPSSAHTYRHPRDSAVPAGNVHTGTSSSHEQQSFHSHRTDYGPTLSEPQSAVSYGAGPYMLPIPALTSQESNNSNRSLSNPHSTPRHHPGRSAEPLQHQPSESVKRRRTDPRRTALPFTSQRKQSIPKSPLNPNPPPSLTRQPITWPSIDADERQIETQPVPHQAPPSHESLYASSMQAPFPSNATATTLVPNPAPIGIKTEPPDRSSLQSVFHSSPALTAPARVHALEKNRLAARKSRTKKRDYIEDLAVSSREYNIENKRLRSKVGELTDEAKALRDTIRQHRDCGGWTGEMQRGVESYLRRVDERQQEEDRQQAGLSQGWKEEEIDVEQDFDAMMEELGEK